MLALAAPALEFRADDHTYWLDGKRVPNVTRVLSLLTDYSHIDPAVLANAQQEGVDMHRMVELYVKGELDEPTLPTWLEPRLAAFKRFQAETGFELLASEQRVYHPLHRYAGTLDLVGKMRMPQSRAAQRITALIDLKRSFYAGRAIGLQTAAYGDAWTASGGVKVTHRFALQLRPGASYRLQPFDDRGDFAHYLACLMVWRLKESMQ